jgi:2-phospho-L-lactate guanylyltransferase
LNKIKYLHIILPHRGVAAGKSRLAGVLGERGRAELNRELLAHALVVATQWLDQAAHCIVVSPCAASLGVARAAGAQALQETGAGLNAAVAQAVVHAAGRGAQRVLILPCDLPRLNAAALDAMAALAVDGATVIAPDRHGTGTNALLTDVHARDFAFGSDSCARHAARARARGQAVALCHRAELAFDLDTPDDYDTWIKSGGVLQTRLIQPGSASTRLIQATTEG